MKKTIWNNFIVSFFNGIVILVPIVISIWLFKIVLLWINNIVLNPILGLVNSIMPAGDIQRVFIAKMLIFVVVVIGIGFIGYAARVIFINRIFSLGEKLIFNVPILGKIYKFIKQISWAFIGQGRTIFKQVVLIEYPRKGLYAIGFATGTSKGEIKRDMGSAVNVFVPTTPNPTSGFFLVVPKESIRFLSMSVEEGLKMVVSGGSVAPEDVESE